VKARDFAPLRRGLAKLSWRNFISTDFPLRIDVSASHCRLYHTGALADTVRLAVEDGVGKLPSRDTNPEFHPEERREGAHEGAIDELVREHGAAPHGDMSDSNAAPDEEVETRILLRGQDDRFAASVDSSGALLHRRGWRLEAGRAPLRETLAAGILALCEYDPASPLVDPMCGAGTFAIEAAAIARKLAPGVGRGFAFERWPAFDPQLWTDVRASAQSGGGAPTTTPTTILASDSDPIAIAMAKRNAARAGVEGDIGFTAAAFGKGEVPATPGLVLINPPYGRRLGQRQQALHLGRTIGQTLAAQHRGWRAAVLCPDPAFLSAVSAGVRRKPAKTWLLRNGGLRVQLALWTL
jgi:putative N6-adenine-specific DNA methylase